MAGNLDYETEPNASILLYLKGAITLLNTFHDFEVNSLFINKLLIFSLFLHHLI